MNPANLPNAQDTGPEYGLVRTILFFALYIAMFVGALLYLRWKLPRHGGADEGAPDPHSPPRAKSD
jgi:hypothetical protein